MMTEDLIELPASSNSMHGSENGDPCQLGCEAVKYDSLPLNSAVTDEINVEAAGTVSNDEDVDMSISSDSEENVDHNITALPVGFENTDSAEVVEKMTSISSVHAEDGSLSVQGEISFSNNKKDETLLCETEIDANSSVQQLQLNLENSWVMSYLCGVKRPRISDGEQKPSVHVIYSSLSRESRQKLEELLQQWARWHSQKSSSSDNSLVESGEKTYYPALRVGSASDKPSALTFWVDNQKNVQSSKEFKPLDDTSVPLYDRVFSLALTSRDASISLDGGMEKLDTSRCFNCSSYSHALKDCPKPRNTVAVNNARREHRSKRNQHTNSHNSGRYYQSSRGGKYDGLTPGMLDAETRHALGLGELDPPPWLSRMRELGYPPGYLDADLDDQPSGITIFGDETNEGEEGEILDASHAEPSKKMAVEFPGINAPIPENADGWLWAPNSSISNLFGYRSQHRHNHSYENFSREYQSERRWSSRDYDVDGPPGCDPGTSPSLSNHFQRHGDYESGYYALSPRASPSVPWSPTYGRSFLDRGRRSPLVRDGSPNNEQYGNFPYSSPG
ncbi:hypothetical protein OROGR_007815 [Orobanche gracilis]